LDLTEQIDKGFLELASLSDDRINFRSVDDCLEIVRTYAGETLAPDLYWLQPIGRKELLARMLRNLKLIYARQDNDVMLFKMIH
jgi:hypothetical protein